MDVRRKLAILADAAKYDASCASSGGSRKTQPGGLGNSEGMGICHSYTPDGRCVSLLKILLTNFCVYDCQYCVNRISSDTPRARFTPEEVANLTVEFYRRNLIEGLFLSSGILKDPDTTMGEMVRVAKPAPRGAQVRWLHPPEGLARRLARAAGAGGPLRRSTQCERGAARPTQDLAAARAREDHARHRRRAWASSARARSTPSKEALVSRVAASSWRPAGQSTQMIVGATAATDQEILHTATHLYGAYQLRRVYYSAFSPIPHHDERLPSPLAAAGARASPVRGRLARAVLRLRGERARHQR